MSYQKRKSTRILERAEVRAAGLAAIDPDLDLGDGRTLSHLNEQIAQLQAQINTYNTALAEIDTIRSSIQDREKKLSDLSAQMLLGVAFQYGKDSPEYQMAGGVRSSDRKRRNLTPRPKPDNTTLPAAM